MKRFNKLIGALIIGIIIYALIELRIISPYQRTSLFAIGINIILAVSLNLIVGITGQFSLGHAGFMAIGAYSVAIVLQSVSGYFGFAIGLIIGIVLAGVLSLIISIPTLRLKGDYLAIATLGFSEIIRILCQNMEITGGSNGISGIEKLLNWPLLYGFIVFSVYIVLAFKKSRYGRACLSINEDELASEAVGINLRYFKILSFTIGIMLAAIAGGLYSIQFNTIAPSVFNFDKSVDILVIVVLGGLGSISGSVLSAILLGVIDVMLAQFQLTNFQVIIYALVLIFIMLFRPKGLFGSGELTLQQMFRRRPKDE